MENKTPKKSNNKLIILGVIVVLAGIIIWYFTKDDKQQAVTTSTTQTKTGFAALNLGNLFSGIFGKTGGGSVVDDSMGTEPKGKYYGEDPLRYA
ncbi:MAG: hypothetical protein V4506_19235 [Bacteroidota bacterium]